MPKTDVKEECEAEIIRLVCEMFDGELISVRYTDKAKRSLLDYLKRKKACNKAIEKA